MSRFYQRIGSQKSLISTPPHWFISWPHQKKNGKNILFFEAFNCSYAYFKNQANTYIKQFGPFQKFYRTMEPF